MHLILAGATGLVGTSVLAHVLSLPTTQVTRLSILSRKPVPMADGHPNVKVFLHNDFGSYPSELLQDLKGAHGVVWAIGVSQSEVDKEQYVKITKDYATAAAKAFSSLSDKVNFVYVSAEGATLKPGMHTSTYGRVKGETEADLLEICKNTPSLHVYSLRSGYVDSIKQPEVTERVKERKKPWAIRLAEPFVVPVMRACWSAGVSPTKDLGRVLTELALSDGKALEGKGIEGEGRTITNVGFRRMAGI